MTSIGRQNVDMYLQKLNKKTHLSKSKFEKINSDRQILRSEYDLRKANFIFLLKWASDVMGSFQEKRFSTKLRGKRLVSTFASVNSQNFANFQKTF